METRKAFQDVLREKRAKPLSRRALLRDSALGFGALGLQSLLAADASTGNPLAPRAPHFAPRAKQVIFLFMHGGPSSIDIFDYKPYLVKHHGEPLPIERPLAFADGKVGPLTKPQWEFRPGGQSGMMISDLFPHVRDRADDLCLIRSMVGEGVDHGAALLQTFTGSSTFTRPSMGSWSLYGLGSENSNLPGYVTIKPTLSHGGSKNWASAFLPGSYQGTAIGHSGMKVDDIQKEPIEYLINKSLSPDQQRF